jgi:hypothetical protein
MRWLLSDAQGGTFVDAEFGIDRDKAAEPDPGFDPDVARGQLKRWLHSSLDGLASVGKLSPSQPSD